MEENMAKVNVYDIAVFLSIIDLPYLEERNLIKRLYELYGNNESLKDFMKKIDHQLEQLDSQVLKDLKELDSKLKKNLITDDYKQDMAHYLKVMKLRLEYSDTDYIKIKFRTLLKQLGYKRRSDKLVNDLTEMFNHLGLVVFKKGGYLGDLSELPLDEFLTIRLRSEDHVKK